MPSHIHSQPRVIRQPVRLSMGVVFAGAFVLTLIVFGACGVLGDFAQWLRQ